MRQNVNKTELSDDIKNHFKCDIREMFSNNMILIFQIYTEIYG